MSITRAEKFRLGMFLIITATILGGVLFYMLGKHLLTEEDPYYIKFSESVGGLLKAANVKLNGVVVGRVVSLEIDTNNVKNTIVHFVVKHGTPIKQDMVANLSGGLSITGLKAIEISGGTQEAPRVPIGGEVKAGVSQLKMLTGQAEAIALKFETLINNLLVFTGDENQVKVSNVLESFNQLSVTLDTLLRSNQASLSTIPDRIGKSITHFDRLTSRTDSVIAELKRARIGAKVGGAVAEFEKTGKTLNAKLEKTDIEKTMKELETAAKNVGEASKTLNNTLNIVREDLVATMRAVKETSQNMSDFSRVIRENPSLLLRSEDKQERGR